MDEPPFALVCGWRYPLLIIAKGGSFSTVSTLRLHSSTSLACGFSYEQKQDVSTRMHPAKIHMRQRYVQQGVPRRERSVFLCRGYDEPVSPAKARWRGLRPDKLGGICDRGYHGMQGASRWFCKIYCGKAVIVGLIVYYITCAITDMDDNSC